MGKQKKAIISIGRKANRVFGDSLNNSEQASNTKTGIHLAGQ
jgi:hypothetical protein